MGYKVYISGPMTGKDYKNKFAMVQSMLEMADNVVANPARVRTPGMTKEEYHEATMELLKMCDTILMLEGWQNIEECNFEFAVAMEQKMTITFEGGKECQDQNRREPESSHRKPGMKFMKGIKAVFSAKKASA